MIFHYVRKVNSDYKVKTKQIINVIAKFWLFTLIYTSSNQFKCGYNISV